MGNATLAGFTKSCRINLCGERLRGTGHWINIIMMDVNLMTWYDIDGFYFTGKGMDGKRDFFWLHE